jgi:hypothetical protein
MNTEMSINQNEAAPLQVATALDATGLMPKPATTNMYAGTQTWSPFKGCKFACTYCVPSFQQQAKRQKHNCGDCYSFVPHQHPDRLSKIPNAKIVFVCGNGDVAFCPASAMSDIIAAINCRAAKRPDQTFYLQTKQPECLAPFLGRLPKSAVLVTTLETNRDEGYRKVSQAPVPSERFRQFLALDYPRKVVTIEPVMDFDLDEFVSWIVRIRPEYVWLGYNSRPKSVQLLEPTAEKMQAFAAELVAAGIEVRGKKLPETLELPGVERHQR